MEWIKRMFCKHKNTSIVPYDNGVVSGFLIKCDKCSKLLRWADDD